MTAKEARELSLENSEENLSEVLQLIKDAARRGEFSVNATLVDNQIECLDKLGYTLNGEFGFYHISW